MAKTIVALYDEFAAAEAAVRELADSGFSTDELSFVANDAHPEARERTGYGKEPGIATGGAAGGIAKLLPGLGAHRIPGLGPVLEAGPLAERAANERIGLVGALGEAGVPKEDAAWYTEGIRRGGTLVTLSVPEDRADRAKDIMERQMPIDIERRAEEWRSAGWSGTGTERQAETATESAPYPYTAQGIDEERKRRSTLDRGEEARIPVMEETVKVGKRAIERGRVRIHTRTVERPVEERVTLREEQAYVERRDVDRPATAEDLEHAFEEGTIEVAQRGEEAVISKETRVTGEVLVAKEATEREQTVRDTVRHTEVQVEDETGTRVERGPRTP